MLGERDPVNDGLGMLRRVSRLRAATAQPLRPQLPLRLPLPLPLRLPLPRRQLHAMPTVKQLQAAPNKKKLDTTGKKAELEARLAAAEGAAAPAATAAAPAAEEAAPTAAAAAAAAAPKERMAATSEVTESQAELKAMVGPAGEEAGLNVVCRVDEYDALLQVKLGIVKALFAENAVEIPAAVQVETSPPAFFRFRADFRVWHVSRRDDDSTDGKMWYAMTPKGTKQPVEVCGFPMGSRKLNELMPPLLEHLKTNAILRKQLYEARFLTTLAGDALITLIYHKPVDEVWVAEAKKVSEQLGVSVVGRSKKKKMVVGEDFVTEELTVLGQQYKYRQKEGAFSQPNAWVCQKMLTFAVECTAGGVSKDVDLLELYCGNGNFTAPMSRNFRKVVGTEIAKESVKLALDNMAENGCDNVQVERLSSEDFSQVFQGKVGVKLSNGGALSGYNLHTLLVDPPRAGMDELTCRVATTFNRMVYISCNPETMVRDVKMMSEMLSGNQEGPGLTIEKFAVFDQFPYTDHLECGALITIHSPNERVTYTPAVEPAGEVAVGADGKVESAVLTAAMEELKAFIADDTRTIIAFAPEGLTSEERNEVRKKAVIETGYKAKSKGSGAQRQLVVVKPAHTGDITAEARAAAQPKRPAEAAAEEGGGAKKQKVEPE